MATSRLICGGSGVIVVNTLRFDMVTKTASRYETRRLGRAEEGEMELADRDQLAREVR